MNVRGPYSISDEFLKNQDEYLFCATSYLPLIFLRNMCFILLAPLFTQEWEIVKKIVFNVFGNKDLEIYKNVLCQKWQKKLLSQDKKIFYFFVLIPGPCRQKVPARASQKLLQVFSYLYAKSSTISLVFYGQILLMCGISDRFFKCAQKYGFF